ncbi:hypothetical protein EZV62_009173 [Acer yangbiense]|uniref:DUF8040 domain-containing protein n=1 Tax=Acer yangbiense TaxID=1000413 RepID=A0A5C7IFS9_9ROSI|nr:hypothetical protein EZV62_009173 [Acer yangbiense]
MFLITLGHGLGTRMVHERFQHSGETVFRWFSIVLDDVCHMAVDFLKPSDPAFKIVPTKIKGDNHYWSYFKDCIGAINGTHIPVILFLNQSKYLISVEKQVKVVIASMVLHNFIRLHAKNDVEFKPYDDDEELLPPNEEEGSEEQDSRYGPNIGALHNREMDKERDQIAVLLMQQ